MEKLKNFDYPTYEHSIRMAELAVRIMREKGENLEKCKEAATAALLHDIGVLEVDPKVVGNYDRYSPKEFVAMKKHVQLGYKFLGDFPDIPESIRQVCLTHHERNNGNGYPKGLTKSQLPELCQFIAFLEVFVALTTYKTYRRSYNYYEALSIIKGHSKDEFNLNYIPYIYDIYPIPSSYLRLEEKK